MLTGRELLIIAVVSLALCLPLLQFPSRTGIAGGVASARPDFPLTCNHLTKEPENAADL